MQYAPVLLLFLLAGVSFSQDWKFDHFGDYVGGDDNLDFDRYITNKRAINGQLRRSSIRWGKRTPFSKFPNEEFPVIPAETMMALWPAPAPRLTTDPERELKNKSKNKDETMPAKTVENQDKGLENSVMERVAKGGIRPKLALSSRLWGR